MSKSRRNPGRRPPPSERAYRATVRALSRISDFGGVALVDGVEVPIVLPLAEWDDPGEFDRAVCAAGLKTFLRPLTAADQPDPSRRIRGGPGDELPRFAGTHILVRELAPGIRTRTGVDFFPEYSLN